MVEVLPHLLILGIAISSFGIIGAAFAWFLRGVIDLFLMILLIKKINKLIVVTGKGIHSQNEKNPYVSKDLSILKYSVPEFISNNKNLMKIIYEMKDAKIEDGGGGAFYIFLKKNKL